MPDENKDAGNSANTAQQDNASPAGESNAGDTGRDGGGSETKDTQKGGDSEKAKAPEEDNAEPAVSSRMTAKDFIIQRQQKKIERLKSKTVSEADPEEEKPEAADDEVAPEDEALITKVVAKKFAPFLNKSMADDDEKEVSAFIAENPDLKPYEAKVKRYMSHPSRRHLPVETIFYEVAGKDLLKLGADRARKADEEAKQTQTGGGTSTAEAKPKNALQMTKEEFEAEQERVRRSMQR
jgi:hypothetical protein